MVQAGQEEYVAFLEHIASPVLTVGLLMPENKQQILMVGALSKKGQILKCNQRIRLLERV